MHITTEPETERALMRRRASRPAQLSPAPERPHPRPLNCLLTPHRRLAREAAELPHTLRAARAVLRPVWAYLGPASAEAYRLYTRRGPDAPARADSLGALAAALRPFLRTEPLEVLALGVGEGAQEVRLAAHLLGDLARPATLALVDLSEPLLAAAYARAAEALPHVELWALLADLEELSTYSDLLYVPGRQRMVVLLGSTLGELEDELRFVRYGLDFCTAGDLLVLDVPLSAGREDAVRRKRQGAAAQQRLDAAAAWLTAALSPYSDGEPLALSLPLPDRACGAAGRKSIPRCAHRMRICQDLSVLGRRRSRIGATFGISSLFGGTASFGEPTAVA